MMMRFAGMAATVWLSMAAVPALAGTAGEARFADGVAVPDKVVVDDRLWHCAEGKCTGPAETRGVAMMRACKTLARGVGAVASYRVGVAGLEADALDSCNTAAR